MNHQRTIVGLVSLAALAAISACGSDNSQAADPSATAATSSAAASTTAKPIKVGDVTAALESLGFTCTDQTGYAMCAQGSVNWQIKQAPQGDRDRPFRANACDGGLIKPNSGVLASDSVVVYAGNRGQDFDELSKQLASKSVRGLTVEGYCPGDPLPTATAAERSTTAPTSARATTTAPAVTAETPTADYTPTAPTSSLAPGIPTEWDKNRDGKIDTDAPIG